LNTRVEFPIPGPDPNSKRVQQLMDVIDTLPKRIRDILYLYYEKGYTKADIAREKGISESMVKKLFQRGQDILREQMIEIDKNDKDIFKP
jgi:DNA-directed RNA polymerase specialized sigma24 family protein